jgi:hypothetical protein
MPYINATDGRRNALRQGDLANTAGELNYQLFYFVKHYFDKGDATTSELTAKTLVDEFLGEKPNYQRFNDMTGALVRCYREIKRRLNIRADFLIDLLDSYDEQIDIYEDIKIKENGDVE